MLGASARVSDYTGLRAHYRGLRAHFSRHLLDFAGLGLKRSPVFCFISPAPGFYSPWPEPEPKILVPMAHGHEVCEGTFAPGLAAAHLRVHVSPAPDAPVLSPVHLGALALPGLPASAAAAALFLPAFAAGGSLLGGGSLVGDWGGPLPAPNAH